MNISDKGLKFVSSFEKCDYVPRRLDSGLWIIGFNHITGKKPDIEKISYEDAINLLREDLKTNEVMVDNALENYKITINTQDQYDSLVDMCYSLGCPKLRNILALALFRQNITLAIVDLYGHTDRIDAEIELFDSRYEFPEVVEEEIVEEVKEEQTVEKEPIVSNKLVSIIDSVTNIFTKENKEEVIEKEEVKEEVVEEKVEPKVIVDKPKPKKKSKKKKSITKIPGNNPKKKVKSVEFTLK